MCYKAFSRFFYFIFHKCARKLAGKVIDKWMKNEKRDRAFSSTTAFLTFGQYNFFPSILTLLFIICSELIFEGNYLPSDSHANKVNLGPTCRSTQNATRGAIFLRIADCS